MGKASVLLANNVKFFSMEGGCRMQEVLSQQEIDLLSSLATKRVSATSAKATKMRKRIREYDFKRPNRFSNEQIRTLEMMHENFARLLSTFLSAHLRTVVEVKLLSVQELSYGEFIGSVLNPTVMVLVSVEELKGQMLFEINPILAFNLLDRLLGGKGGGKEEYRALTEIEVTIIKRLFGQVINKLSEAWIYVFSLVGNIERLETNPLFVHMVAENEMVALVSLEIKMHEVQGVINLCFPYTLLKPVARKLNAHHWFSQSEKEVVAMQSVNILQERLLGTVVPIIVELGRTTIAVKDLLELQVGDVVSIGSRITEDIDVLICERPKFRARPGMLGDKYAVEITGIRREGEADV
jgi:flagellar motor switch protein FliM